ncbi:radical SAM protein [Streptomyces sp. LX-29]|uniref:radical SAM protein n=1 Tax=Streptomyces sp. LX-29 TaxID=2900152 RepID=UPI00240D9C34|nr:radical SAM protein [Streptomyces sp. LX-29]WFB08197.1 radical SAM protein [Streptomyces sp. LX-29]
MSTETVPERATPTHPPFRTALISTAGHCAVACGFCFRTDRAHGFLDIATFTRALSRLKEIGVEGVCLTGGEPTHHPELRQLVRLAHQFGMPVSVVTSARTSAEVTRLAEVSHLLTNVTVSADSAGAMRLGRTTRSVASGVSVLAEIETPVRVLHLTYWQVMAEECREIHQLLSDKDINIQLSPVTFDEKARTREALSLDAYVRQHRADADLLGRYIRLSPRFQEHLVALRAMQLYPERQHPCRSAALYVSSGGELRRCPYSRSGVPVHAPRSDVASFLARGTQDWTTPDCAAICRADT